MTQRPTHYRLSGTLEGIVHEAHIETIQYFIAQRALDYDSPLDFFHTLVREGCGSIDKPIFKTYSDTIDFFESHYEEINLLQVEASFAGRSIDLGYNLKIALSWFAVEEVANQMALEFGVS